ncbi:N-6 DNA methylase [Kitasatospora sp. YST-16]|uniref:HsdM family class I SAM-dependent methyltransferase n=1 Tax=Kitasatospora sp. YST-16 TaxID=2998080 RepID=UPI002284E05F|nr:N-6 DNA methylase [Kitasatospora sp. YST-16]WAL71588.1 N-6 DNA methylase [Kitasatospora sp. YST-16]WNW37628.1 N-6 DNA methylase [Streptomyces sp. Li-HN-5-13]
MSNEAIRDALAAVGYEFVQFEPPIPGGRDRWRPDVVAWAADSNGALTPRVAIEVVKSRAPIRPEAGLRALARARDMLGTADHYVVVNDAEWYRADPGLQRLTQVEGPEAPPNGGEGEIEDVELVTALLSHELWKTASRARDSGSHASDSSFNLGAAIDLTGFQTLTSSGVRVSPETLWQARRRAVVDFERRHKEAGEFTSHKGVSKAVAHLAGSRLTRDLLDPFCGAGSFLWEAIDYAQDHVTGLNTVLGYDVNQRMADVARSIGSVSPVPVEIITGDAFKTDLPPSTCLVSAPPFSLRLQKHYELLDGSTTRDGDLAVLDRVVRLLGEGSRAVLHLPASVTYRSNGEPYRRFLASRFRVAAILGLPPGVVAGTAIRSILIVIDKAEPGDTFIAQLGEDWESQLAPGGAALEAALVHVDGARP